MSDADRIPKRLRAVTSPEEFEPFHSIATPEDFEATWETNSAWALANLAHTAYHCEKNIERLLEKCGARQLCNYLENGAQAFLAVWSDRAVLSFRGTKPSEHRPLASSTLRSIQSTLERVLNAAPVVAVQLQAPR